MTTRTPALRPTPTSSGAAIVAALLITGLLVAATDLVVVGAGAIVGGTILAIAGIRVTRRSVRSRLSAGSALIGAVVASAVVFIPLVTGRALIFTLMSLLVVAAWYLLALTVSGAATATGLSRLQSLLYRQVVGLLMVVLVMVSINAGSLSGVGTLFQSLGQALLRTLIDILSIAPVLVGGSVGLGLLVFRSAVRRGTRIGLLKTESETSGLKRRAGNAARGLKIVVGGFIIISGALAIHQVIGGPVRLLSTAAGLIATSTSGNPAVVLAVTGIVAGSVLLRGGIELLALAQRTSFATVGYQGISLVPGVTAGVCTVLIVGWIGGILGGLRQFLAGQSIFGVIIESGGIGATGVVAVVGLSLPLVTGLAAVGLANRWGLLRGTQGIAALASGCLLVAVLIATPFTTGVLVTIVGVGAALLVWDSLAFGLRLGKDLGWTPRGVPNELTHSLASYAASVLAGGVAIAGLIAMTQQRLPAIDQAISIALAGGAVLLLLTGIGDS